MASDAITSWLIDQETMKTVTDYFLELQNLQMVTAAMKLEDDCFLEGSYDKSRQCIEKQRHHFADQVCRVKAMAFPVVMYRYESWTIKKAEH